MKASVQVYAVPYFPRKNLFQLTSGSIMLNANWRHLVETLLTVSELDS